MSALQELAVITDGSIRDEIESYVTGWIGSLEMGVQRIESSSFNIDKPQAIRGHVVGMIIGDAANGLSGAVVDLREAHDKPSIASRYTRRIKLGTGQTWFASTGAIDRFGDKLPDLCVAGFNDIFSEYRPFVEGLLGGAGPIADLESMFYDTQRLLIIMKNFPTTGQHGVDNEDLRYAFNLFKPGGLLYV